MSRYYFLLGNTPELSRLELASLLPGSIQEVSETLASYDGDLDLNFFSQKLGGTVEIAEKVKEVTSLNLVPSLIELISSDPQKNVAITNLSAAELTSATLKEIKEAVVLKRPVRFLSLETSGHSLVALRKQHVSEYLVISEPGSSLENSEPGSEMVIAKTVWIHDADSWTLRDRKKPYRDIKHGMLPPKVARIMVNLATRGDTKSVLDPFCGTGTVLAEAVLLGCAVFGSDTSPIAVRGAKLNLEWLKNVYELRELSSEVWESDATHVDSFVKAVDAIVTEPYMGPLQESDRPLPSEKIKNIAKGLDKLYRGALRAWYPLLPPRGRVVICLPPGTIPLDAIVRLGYNYVASVPYGKPGARVIRNITILEKN